MITRTYDPSLPYTYVVYLRMSSEEQNASSPEQQDRSIEEAIRRLGFPWRRIGTYRDDGISGRYVAKRPDFQRMLGDIRSRRLKPDLITIDLRNRLGRVDDLAAIQNELRKVYGVLIVNAISGFADPTTAVGRLTAAFDDTMAIEENRNKAHQVLNGKRDAVLRGYWPGGKPPRGFKLETVCIEKRGHREVVRKRLVHDDETKWLWIVRRFFALVIRTGLGAPGLAAEMNLDPLIDDKYKPFIPGTMRSWLENTLYYGTMTFPRRASDIVNDTAITEWRPAEDLLIIPNYCPPIIERADWEEAQASRRARKAARALGREQATSEEKLLAPLTPGYTYKYPLNGLVRCGNCGSAMAARLSNKKEYRRTGIRRAYYYCPLATIHACGSYQESISEVWLREAVLAKLRFRLFPPPDERGAIPEWYSLFADAVRRELEAMTRDDVGRVPVLRKEVQALEVSAAGFSLTLSDPLTGPLVRARTAEEYEGVLERIRSLTRTIAESGLTSERLTAALDPRAILEKLNRLDVFLGKDQPTLLHVELSRIIAGIDCHADGRVVMRTTPLGLFEGAVSMLSGSTDADAGPAGEAAGTYRPIKRRSRGTFHVYDVDDQVSGSRPERLSQDVDPDRFAGLGPEWFWSDELDRPDLDRTKAEEISDQVLAMYQKTKWTPKALARSFKCHARTIQKALQIAVDRAGLPYPSWPKSGEWAGAHSEEVWASRQETGKSIRALGREFGHGTVTIKAALLIAAGVRGVEWDVLIPDESWAAAQSEEVWAKRQQSGMSVKALVKVFARNRATIEAALVIAAGVRGADWSLAPPRGSGLGAWAEEHSEKVWAKRQETGKSIGELRVPPRFLRKYTLRPPPNDRMHALKILLPNPGVPEKLRKNHAIAVDLVSEPGIGPRRTGRTG